MPREGAVPPDGTVPLDSTVPVDSTVPEQGGFRIGALDVSVYTVPTDQPEADGTFAWDSTTMVLVVVSAADAVGRAGGGARAEGGARTGGGARAGLGWTYAPAAAAHVIRDQLAPVVMGLPVTDVPAAHSAMVRAVRNIGRQGVAACALSAVDIALWDLKAKLLDVPLHRLLGTVRPSVPVYGSGGFTTYDRVTLERQLSGWVHDEGIPRVKIKIGESWGRNECRDVERIRQARTAIGDYAELYVDANGGYGVKQAIRVLERVQDQDVRWFEEPVSSDDLPGLASVRRSVRAEVAAGEYGWDPYYFQRMCGSDAVDCVQADVTRCGGITGWLQAARIAAAHQLDISGHCAPHVSVAAAAATPNLRHLEWFHDHVRIEQLFFEGTLDAAGGYVTPDDSAPGLGLMLRRKDAEPYRVG